MRIRQLLITAAVAAVVVVGYHTIQAKKSGGQ